MTDHSPNLIFDNDGTPRSERFGDIYYSPEDGLSETQAVFFDGCDLPKRFAGRHRFTVLELGFGTGLNIAALIRLWQRNREPGAILDIFTVEAFLMEAGQAARALSHWPELDLQADALIAQWPPHRRGLHVMVFPQWGVQVTVALKPIMAALSDWDIKADAHFLDGFSPDRNPDMWSNEVMAEVGRLSAPGARVGTFTVAGHVRRKLEAAGFVVKKVPGFGRKRERLEAVFPDTLGEAPVFLPSLRIAIVGAGIGGASLSHYARLSGLVPDLYDRDGIGSGASGNPAALVTPRLDAGNSAISALFADAFYHATALYTRLCPQAILSQGVRLLAENEDAGRRYTRISGQEGFVAGDLDPRDDGLWQRRALSMSPPDVIETLLAGQAIIRQPAEPQPAADGRWHIDDQVYDAVILASGVGLIDRLSDLDLRAVRGQIELARMARPDHALSGDGYVIPLPDGLLFGATHDRNDRGCDVRAQSRRENLDRLQRLTGLTLDGERLESRARIRVSARDYLPVAGQVAPGLWVLGGMGARGFCLAPWLALGLIARLCGRPDPTGRLTQKVIAANRPSLARKTYEI